MVSRKPSIRALSGKGFAASCAGFTLLEVVAAAGLALIGIGLAAALLPGIWSALGEGDVRLRALAAVEGVEQAWRREDYAEEVAAIERRQVWYADASGRQAAPADDPRWRAGAAAAPGDRLGPYFVIVPEPMREASGVGVTTYRLAISWPVVMPRNEGDVTSPMAPRFAVWGALRP